MPEFPEVYTIIKDLKKVLERGVIKGITPVGNYKILPSNDEAINLLKNTKILDVWQIAKNIIISTNAGYINIHLAMTGQVLVKKTKKPLAWERVTFEVETSQKTFFLAFRDTRMFGKVHLLNQEEYEKLISKYGPEPLSPEFTVEKFSDILSRKDTKIKNFLMEQDKIGGLGNIYATEALFLSGIQPETRTKELSAQKIKLLLESIKKVIKEGIQYRGSTLEDEMFVDIFGKKGKNQDYLKIYNKSNCPNCNTRVETVKISGRNSYFCPRCQPKINAENKMFPDK